LNTRRWKAISGKKVGKGIDLVKKKGGGVKSFSKKHNARKLNNLQPIQARRHGGDAKGTLCVLERQSSTISHEIALRSKSRAPLAKRVHSRR